MDGICVLYPRLLTLRFDEDALGAQLAALQIPVNIQMKLSFREKLLYIYYIWTPLHVICISIVAQTQQALVCFYLWSELRLFREFGW